MNDPRDSSSPFGVLDFLAWDHERFGRHYQPGDVEKAAALMQEAGIGFVRFDFLWEDLEPKSGFFEFSKYDHLVNTLLKHDIKTLGLLAYNPPWTGKAWNQAPDLVAYCRYAVAVVDHFKDRVRHWELWHEPDSPDFWQPQDNMRSYIKLLQHAYPLLKAADSTSMIHLGGMSRSLPMSLKEVYTLGGKDFFDVVNIHPFANPLTLGALDAVRHMHKFVCRILEDYDDANKPIWFTEIGCPGMKDAHASANWWLGANPSDQAQADWVSAVYGEPLHWKNVQKIFWCFFRETENHFKTGSDYDGLVRHDFSKKPAFEAYRKAVAHYEERSTTDLLSVL
jgi:hypothetical protein